MSGENSFGCWFLQIDVCKNILHVATSKRQDGLIPMKNYSTPQLGLRVKHAREALKLNQEDLKDKLGFKDRQTVSDIENGKRALKAEELLQLADALDKDVQFFLNPFSVVAEATFNWRASPELSGDDLDRFEVRAGGWIGLLRWLRNEHKVDTPFKPVLRLTERSAFELAQEQAEQLVKAYELGPVPAKSLVDFIGTTLDIPVLFVDTGESSEGGSISGAACDLGGELGVVLVNRNEPPTRRYFNLAHEFFHALTWEAMKPSHRESNSVADRKGSHRIEQLANCFAAALLMPTSSLDVFIETEKAGDVGHLAEVAAKLRVSNEALSWRLFQLGRVDKSTQKALAASKSIGVKEDAPKPFSPAFVSMLHNALDRGWLTARKAASAMDMSLGELKEVFAVHEMPSPFDL